MFSKEWEKAYKLNTQQSIWPWSEMISLVSRHTRKVTNGVRVLELGCGTGANIPFFLKKKFDYYAIEGSKTAIKSIIKRYPNLKKKNNTR